MISAIVLAAGTSSRMKGRNKLLLPLFGKTAVQLVVENILAAEIGEVIVVTGHQAKAVQDLLTSMPVKLIQNDDFESGMTTSIQKGVSIANGDGYMICLSDMPFIKREDYALLNNFFSAKKLVDPACICVPVYKGEQGNPVVFSSFYKEEILQHSTMQGCKRILQAHPLHIHYFKPETDVFLKDIDTTEEYLIALWKQQW